MNMQVINSRLANGFRELTSDEIMMVSGGGDDDAREPKEIVVTGARLQNQASFSSGFLGFSISDGLGHGFRDINFIDDGGDGGGGDGGPTHHPDGTDSDGDGINETPPIVVTAPENPLPLVLANDFAARAVTFDLFFYGAVLGAVGADLTAVLRAAGLPTQAAAGINGGLSGLGIVTSASELLPQLRDNLQEIYRDRYLQDIIENPERYQNYILINGEPFDASTLDD